MMQKPVFPGWLSICYPLFIMSIEHLLVCLRISLKGLVLLQCFLFPNLNIIGWHHLYFCTLTLLLLYSLYYSSLNALH